MSMSRQDFTAVAHVLRAEYFYHNETESPSMASSVWMVANSLAAMFAGKYPAFDRDRFLAAVRGD